MPFLLLLTTAAGPLGRAEWSWVPDAEPDARTLQAALVDAAAAELRADPRVATTGLRVEAGCTPSRCTLALDGLAGPLLDALPALKAVATADDRSLRPAARRALRKAWRTGPRSPSRVFDAAIRRVVGGEPTPGGARPRLGAAREDAAWDRLRARAALDVAGDLPAEATDAVEALVHGVPGAPAAAARAPAAVAEHTLLVDWPGAARAQVALVWTSGPDDGGRDAWLAGDFESALVQRLREREGLTYDVEPLYGDGWAGAAFDVAPEAVLPALAAAREELSRPPAVPDAARQGAHLRLAGRTSGLNDSLAGQLLLSRLPPLPGLDDPFAAVGPVAVVVVGDAARVGLAGAEVVPPTALWAGLR